MRRDSEARVTLDAVLTDVNCRTLAALDRALPRSSADFLSVAVLDDERGRSQAACTATRLHKALCEPIRAVLDRGGKGWRSYTITAACEVVGGDFGPFELRDAVSTNLLAPLLLTRAALPRLAERGGWVVNVSSMAATAAFPGMAAYAATKAGLSQLSRVLAPEAAAQGVGMTLVTLGPVVTAMLESNRGYDPVRAAFDRARRLRFSRELEPAAVARALVDATAAGCPELVLPRRMTPFALLGRLPQRITAFLLRGLPALAPCAP